MTNKKNKGFTLIELISVLVILAILALIVTPLVLNIIRKARVSADKRSIDAYGRSIELAVASYLLDNGTFPTSIEQLTIEHAGDKVECQTTKLNSDSSVYLANCTVAGREVKDYTYGEEAASTYTAYKVGDEVKYNNVDYYVIADSDASETSVTLLKKTPLTVAEVNQFGTGHVNMHVPSNASYYQTAYDNNGYGGMQYYSSETCGYVNGSYVKTGCTNAYANSEIKYVVDAWKASEAPAATEARLIKKDEYKAMITVETYETPTEPGTRYVPMYDWMYSNNYWYWTMSPAEDSVSSVCFVNSSGNADNYTMDYDRGIGYGVVRPVITISKSELN